jgi:hypothetical protein
MNPLTAFARRLSESGSIADLQRLVLEQLTARPEVGHVQTNLILLLLGRGPLLRCRDRRAER